MGGLECVITGLMDEYQDTFRRRGISREMFTGFVVFSSYVVAITCVTPVRTSYSGTLCTVIVVIVGWYLYFQSAGELCSRTVTADHCVLWGGGSVLGVWSQQLQWWRLLHVGSQTGSLLEDHLEVHLSLLPHLHHHPADDRRVRVHDGDLWWYYIHVSTCCTLGWSCVSS